MNRILNKIIAFISIVALMFTGFAVNVFALNEDLHKDVAFEKTVLTTEYESLKKINVYKDIDKDYKKYIVELNKLSDFELKEKNFQKDQIHAIRNFDGSTLMLKAASPRIKMSLSRESYNYSSSANKTTITVKATGNWEGVPFVKGMDTVALTLVGSTAKFNKKSASMVVTHNNNQKVYPHVEYTSMIGIKSSFGIAQGSGSNPTAIYKSFVIRYTGVAQGKVTVYDYGAAYTHKKPFINPEISLGLSFNGVGISVGAGIIIRDASAKEWAKVISVN